MAEEVTNTGGEAGIAEEARPEGIAGEENPEGIAEGQAEQAGGDGMEGKTPQASEGKGKDAPQAPYELTAPEDFPLPEANLKSFTEACNKLGLSREQAEGMLNWHREFHNAVTGEAQQNAARVMNDWQKEMQADKDFGGAHLKATVAEARKALAAFDPDGGLRALLRESGYQHHPEVIRAVARIGRAMSEHDFIGANGEGKADAPLEERLYPNMETGK